MATREQLIEHFKKNGFQVHQVISGDNSELDSFDLVVLLLDVQKLCEKSWDESNGDFMEVTMEHIANQSTLDVNSFIDYILSNLIKEV